MGRSCKSGMLSGPGGGGGGEAESLPEKSTQAENPQDARPHQWSSEEQLLATVHNAANANGRAGAQPTGRCR